MIDSITNNNKTHFGKIHSDGPFCGVAFNHSNDSNNNNNKEENLIAFIAERPDIKNEDLFTFVKNKKKNNESLKSNDKDKDKSKDSDKSDKKDKEKEKEKEKEKKTMGKEFEWKETWGEQMKGATSTSLFIYDLKTKKIITVINDFIIPKNASLGDIQFAPDNSGVIVTAYEMFPRKLG